MVIHCVFVCHGALAVARSDTVTDADDAGADAVAGASRGLHAYVYGLFIDCRFLTES